ncbi:UDP-4-amino-4,6-dideoxy-N-acetyl-beta-L-altrosamine transaminase [Gimibacter soli]|uniref:UDP-4-amino-4, 6-dideoxy-N-acetyl-beta-L-altrosamine transaminase n=1 Tax=Gimibacter soli TaxID=3024400 RepID=A0AAE9XN13_9PROT|nr:UDP-4-amino-4,6-dideoxy-N-acetyl-beta-L-altrosamine transaminase [Gimibacter soli]WCL53047.1 UDP-4-amino-4,6-dideoxy-N-acetyl-beta-L-altrosamine transaminase [Gimibacter soli]
MPADFLPYGRHSIDEDDIAAVAEVLRGSMLTGGPKVAEFERAFAARVGAKEAVACSNGTTALHLACIAAGLREGDRAIVPSVTFLSTANAVRMCGAEVVFADVDPDTGLLTPASLRTAFAGANGPVKAVLPVHLNGQIADMEEIAAIARQAGAAIITDCAHAIGAEYAERGTPGDGQWEDLACFSLHPVKTIAMGEGGVVTTNDASVAARLRRLRGHDMRRGEGGWLAADLALDEGGEANPWFYEMQELGYNYRATDFQCALGLSQLGKLDRFIAARRAIADRYDALLKPHDNLLRPIPRMPGQSAWHLYPVLIDYEALGTTRARLMRALVAEGIGTQVHYIPVHWQPYYRARYGEQDLPGAAAYYRRALSLPIFPALPEDGPERVVEALVRLLG